MKMKDLNEAFDSDDFGLKGHGAELDKDIDPNAKRYNNELVIAQAGKLSDYPDGGEIETDDGEKIPVSQQEARFIRNLELKKLAPYFGIEYKMARDPDADDAVQTKLQSSEGLMKLLGLIRK